jgi:DinB family protein
MTPELQQVLRALDQAYDKRSWHGTNLRGSVRGLSPELAARRPAPGRHNVWEIVVHAAYWKYAVWRRLTGAGRGSFPLKGSNWFERPGAGPLAGTAWRDDLTLLGNMHRQLREAVAAVSPRALGQRSAGSAFTNADLIIGIAAHDLYHAGQIQLIKRLLS